MFNRMLILIICLFSFFCSVPAAFGQDDLGGDRGFIFEEQIEGEFLTELEEKKTEPRYITADVLTHEDVRPALLYYIRSDIDRKFSGLITNLKLEKIHGIFQEEKTATVYFDYSYTSVRNTENILMDKGKMTLIKFNSGRWFNAELSIFLMDFYSIGFQVDKQPTEE